MLHPIEKWNFRLGNALDVDLDITWAQNVPIHQKIKEKQRKQVCFNEKGNHACKNGKNNDDQKIYASMEQMSSNDERSSEKYGGSSQLTNWILDLGATWHMTPEISDFIPESL